jgi:hypothetical protein
MPKQRQSIGRYNSLMSPSLKTLELPKPVIHERRTPARENLAHPRVSFGWGADLKLINRVWDLP